MAICYCCCCCLVAKSCPTLCDLLELAYQAPLSMGFPRQENWNGLPFPSRGELPEPGIKPMPPALAGRFFSAEPPGKPKGSSLNLWATSLESWNHTLTHLFYSDSEDYVSDHWAYEWINPCSLILHTLVITLFHLNFIRYKIITCLNLLRK